MLGQYRSTLKNNDCLRCIWSAAQRAQKLILADADCRFDTGAVLARHQIKYKVWHIPYVLKRTLSGVYTKNERRACQERVSRCHS